MDNRKQSGFTLAELLISLGILGVIATFSIPKILQSMQTQKKMAVFKETIAAMNEALHTGLLQNAVVDSNFGTYMMTHLNAVKICDTNAKTQGCWNSTYAFSGQETAPGVLLHNGAMIAGLDDTPGSPYTGADTVIVDWNGLDGPNVEGDDVIIVRAFFDNTSSSDRVGTIRQDPLSHPSSTALWKAIFQ